MNFQELNQNEMAEINGGGLLDGGLLGGGTSGNMLGGLTSVLGINNLLSISNESTSTGGNKTSITVGNGLGLNLGGILNGLNL